MAFKKYLVVSKSEFEKNNYYSNFYYDFKKLVLLEFEGSSKSDKTFDKAFQDLTKLYVDIKNNEIDTNIKWLIKRTKQGFFNEEIYEEVVAAANKLRTELDKGLVKPDKNAIFNITIQKPRVQNINHYVSSTTLKNYEELVQSLYDKVEKLYKDVEIWKNYFDIAKNLLDENKQILNEHYAKQQIIYFYTNIKLAKSWCKNPVNFVDKDKIEQLKIIKSNLESFKKIIGEEKERKENLKNIKNKIENIKKLLVLEEIEVGFKDLKNKILIELKEYENMPKHEILNDLEEIVLRTEILFDEATRTYDKCLKPYLEIEQFIQSDLDFLIIKGMAGTGKTECINKIIEAYSNYNNQESPRKNLKKIIVCAKTTVAAANIRQKGFFYAKTLQSIKPDRDKGKNEVIELVIVDEANMLTPGDLSKVKKTFGNNKDIKYVFIGDSGQFLPYDFNKKLSSEAKALSKPYCEKIFGKGHEIVLDIDYRLQENFSNEYYDFIKTLREGGVKNPIELYEEMLKNSEDIIKVEDNDPIISFFNKYVHIGVSVRDRLKNNEELEDILYYLKKQEEVKKSEFNDKDMLKSLEHYKQQKNRRPELGSLYAQYYPKESTRLKKENNINSIVSLFRSNIQADYANLVIRPYIFDNFDENKPILKSEVMYIKSQKNSREDENILKTNLEVGDSFVVVGEPKPLSYQNLWELEVKPVIKFQKNKFSSFIHQKLPEFLNLDKRKIIVWCGDLQDTAKDDKQLEKDYEDEMKTLESLDGGLYKYVQRVKYDYARVSYASQGGEWDNVIIQLEDSWDESRFLYTCFTRALKQNYIFS